MQMKSWQRADPPDHGFTSRFWPEIPIKCHHSCDGFTHAHSDVSDAAISRFKIQIKQDIDTNSFEHLGD